MRGDAHGVRNGVVTPSTSTSTTTSLAIATFSKQTSLLLIFLFLLLASLFSIDDKSFSVTSSSSPSSSLIANKTLDGPYIPCNFNISSTNASVPSAKSAKSPWMSLGLLSSRVRLESFGFAAEEKRLEGMRDIRTEGELETGDSENKGMKLKEVREKWKKEGEAGES
ncbi:unnamed protein product [Dovyalis caffra]|uniref:Uncharacterized protein n=1 Tax=Dovyalis caffra TaxID=77055 RepID=A0AAV1SIT7_9ROSI|nr:unnamed protein product [Dovyalis caffra]